LGRGDRRTVGPRRQRALNAFDALATTATASTTIITNPMISTVICPSSEPRRLIYSARNRSITEAWVASTGISALTAPARASGTNGNRTVEPTVTVTSAPGW
jgi:hypothetical protein